MMSHLLQLLKQRTEEARRTGAIEPIETSLEFMVEEGIRFQIRRVSSLIRKASQPKSSANPFRPFDERLFVKDLGPHYIGLLNKFSVIENHLLMVTREFVSQESRLREQDFEVAGFCLDQIDGLVFYNSGLTSGASQPHRHLQLVPLPLAEPGPGIPVEAVFPAEPVGAMRTVPALPFRNCFFRFEPDFDAKGEGIPRITEIYDRMLDVTGARLDAYNLLLTRRWMMLIPRTRGAFGPISVNALGYAGSLLAKNQEEVKLIQSVGPLKVLAEAGVPAIPTRV